ncbi:MAG: MFS transporter [Sporolactobacillus sp.]
MKKKRSTVMAIGGFIAGMLAFVMAILDTTIVNIVLPDMITGLHATVTTISWVLNAYNMAFAVLLLSASRLADQFGRRKLFILGIISFTTASLLCGFAPTIGALIAFRVIQGAAAAVLVPVSLPILLTLFDKKKQTLIIALWGACSALASASGPVLGGLLTHYGSWHDVFFVNIPLGILALVLTILCVPESFDPSAGRRIDWSGMLSLSAAVAALAFYLIKGNTYGWFAPEMLLLPAMCLLALFIFLWLEAHVACPMLPFTLFRSRRFRFSNYTVLFIGIVINAVMFLCSLYLTRIRGFSVLHAGYVLTALPIGSLIFSLLTSRLIKKVAPAALLVIAAGMIAASSWLMGHWQTDTATESIIAVLFFSGAGFGINLPVIMNLIVDGVPGGGIGIASGLGNMARTLGSIVGVALIVAVLTGSLTHSMTDLKKDALHKIAADTQLTPAFKQAMTRKIKHMQTKTTSIQNASNQRAIKQKLLAAMQAAYRKDTRLLRARINHQAGMRWRSIADRFRNARKQVMQLPGGAPRGQALAQLAAKQALAKEQFTKQKALKEKQLIRRWTDAFTKQQREVIHLTDWLHAQTERRAMHAFSVSYQTIAWLAATIMIFCPFMRRKA